MTTETTSFKLALIEMANYYRAYFDANPATLTSEQAAMARQSFNRSVYRLLKEAGLHD